LKVRHTQKERHATEGECHKTFFSSQLANGANKLACLSLGKPLQPSLKFPGKAGAYSLGGPFRVGPWPYFQTFE